MKIERIVQLLFYLLVIIIALGLISYNNKRLFPSNFRNTLIYIVSAFIVVFLAYYFIPKRKEH